MRLAVFVAIACTCLGLSALFLPTGELVVRQPLATHRVEKSLYELGKSTGAVRRFLARYRSSTARKLGEKALDKVTPHLPGALRSRAEDVQEAAAVLDGLRDEDIDTAGTIMSTTLWSLLSLQVLLVLLLQGTGLQTGRARLVVAALVSLVVSGLGVGIYLALVKIVEAANAELEGQVFSLRTGAYLLPIATVAAALAVLAAIIGHTLGRRALARAAAAPMPGGAAPGSPYSQGAPSQGWPQGPGGGAPPAT